MSFFRTGRRSTARCLRRARGRPACGKRHPSSSRHGGCPARRYRTADGCAAPFRRRDRTSCRATFRKRRRRRKRANRSSANFCPRNSPAPPTATSRRRAPIRRNKVCPEGPSDRVRREKLRCRRSGGRACRTPGGRTAESGRADSGRCRHTAHRKFRAGISGASASGLPCTRRSLSRAESAGTGRSGNGRSQDRFSSVRAVCRFVSGPIPGR